MTLDEAINKFRDFAQGKGDFDELDLKEVIVDNRDEAVLEAYGEGVRNGWEKSEEGQNSEYDIFMRITDEIVKELLTERTGDKT